MLNGKYKEEFPETKCDTRWIKNHDQLIRLKDSFNAFIDPLDEKSFETNSNTSLTQTSFLMFMISSDFFELFL